MTHGSEANLALVIRLCQGSYCLFSCGVQNDGVIKVARVQMGSVLIFFCLFLFSFGYIWSVCLICFSLPVFWICFVCIFCFCGLHLPLILLFFLGVGSSLGISFSWGLLLLFFGYYSLCIWVLVQIGLLEVVDKRGLVDT